MEKEEIKKERLETKKYSKKLSIFPDWSFNKQIEEYLDKITILDGESDQKSLISFVMEHFKKNYEKEVPHFFENSEK